MLGLRTVDPSTPQADSETSSVFSDKDTASPMDSEGSPVYFDKDTASPLDPESSSVYFDSVRTLGSRAIYSEREGEFSVGVIQVIQMIKAIQIAKKSEIQIAQEIQEIHVIQGEGRRLPRGREDDRHAGL